MELISFFNQDHCCQCNNNNCIICIDEIGRPVPLSKIIANPAILDSSKGLSYMKCNKCGQEYVIDWSEPNRIPKPLVTNVQYNRFLLL